ncbi:hypothetical protein AJ80_03300 [Polytolypa hystricis UAMH7299]|uniref:NAD(P)-binding domain-containing protein n=1 Tax=Polytolypa hystricis (strain UAMH7299) TaxID=1447883 RepID=A0A2B7YK53_POLH7|nr:hypothetical protein AJ80_03300 [Polytolypa hystricis UAMH7299]
MPNPRVLILGGHGKIAMLLTPLLRLRNWDVISLIRNPAHAQDILNISPRVVGGNVEIMVSSLDDVKSEADAKAILDRADPDYVVWAAGAGGKGAPSRTYTIDRDVANYFTAAICATPSIKKYLLISHLGSRRRQPSWMEDADWEHIAHINNDVLPDYYRAKLAADEYFTAMTKRRVDRGDKTFQAICLRPGVLADAPATGRVELGKTVAMVTMGGSVNREDVAAVTDGLLARDDTRGWYDLLGGDEPVEEAIDRVVRDKVDAVEGENVKAMCARYN